MTYELLLVIAQLCQFSDDSASRSQQYSTICQKKMIECVELNPTPVQVAKCVKEGKTK